MVKEGEEERLVIAGDFNARIARKGGWDRQMGEEKDRGRKRESLKIA